MDAIGELLFYPLLAGAERAWDLCFKPQRRRVVLADWRARRGWQNARTVLEVLTTAAAVALAALLVVVPIVLLASSLTLLR